MKMPKSRGIYSVNEGNSLYWTDACKEYFESIKYPKEPDTKPYSARYIGSMVADAYRTLCYGGMFAYPADTKSPKGKLRILYECAPMAMVMENGKLPNGNSVCGCGVLVANCVFSWRPGGHKRDEENARCCPRAHTRQIGYFYGLI